MLELLQGLVSWRRRSQGREDVLDCSESLLFMGDDRSCCTGTAGFETRDSSTEQFPTEIKFKLYVESR
jgi:hypothetical protein